MELTVAHLFAGGGGGILAAEILGHRSILAVEQNEQRCEILRQRTNDGWFPRLTVECCDIREFDWSPWAGRVDCLAAGFPCQDISCAGPGTGIDGKRSRLVREVFRAINVVRPGMVYLENSPRIRTRGRHIVIRELVERGYSWRDGTLKASHVGAGHQRNRWWCLAANADGKRKLEQERGLAQQRGWISDSVEDFADTDKSRWKWGAGNITKKKRGIESKDSNQDTADTFNHRLQRCREQGAISESEIQTISAAAGYCSAWLWSPPDAGVCRMVDGLAHRMDRIKTCGDGQVPLQAAVAWALLAWK